jgi:hypothetical protein
VRLGEDGRGDGVHRIHGVELAERKAAEQRR